MPISKQAHITYSNLDMLSAIAVGDKNAEQELVNKYYKSLLFIIRRQTQEPELANDICQETFLKVIQKARNSEIKNPDAVGSYIKQTGINKFIEFKRKKARQKTEVSSDNEWHQSIEDLSSINSINTKELCDTVRHVMDELQTERDRDILRHFFVYGKEKHTICDDMGLKAEHFDRVLFRARQRLKQNLALKLKLADDKCNLFQLLSICSVYLCFTILIVAGERIV